LILHGTLPSETRNSAQALIQFAPS
jgi:hypothetical protein